MVAKVSDLGIARLQIDGNQAVSSEFRGSLDYLDPSYLTKETQVYTKACDVYSFGLITLLLVSGKSKAVEAKQLQSSIREAESVAAGAALIRDKCMPGNAPVAILWSLAELAVACMSRDPRCRPVMSGC